MKKILILLMMLLSSQPVMADDINVEMNGDLVEFENKPMIIENRTMVPLRFVMDNLGYQVHWLEETRQVKMNRGNHNILLTIDQADIQIGDKTYTSDVKPMIIDDRTYVPLALIAEATGAKVAWKGETRTVTVDETLSFINLFYGNGSYKNFKSLEGDFDKVNQVSYAWSRVEVKNGQATINTTSLNGNDMFYPSGHDLVTKIGNDKLLNIYADSDYDVIFNQSQQLIQSIKSKILAPDIDEPEFDGLVLNFEGMKADDYELFIEFVSSLRSNMPNIRIDIAVQPRDFDYSKLLSLCDHMILMLHDYETKTDMVINFNQNYVDQPIAPLDKIKQDLDKILVNIPAWERHKLLLQLNLAVVQWQGDTSYEVTRYTPSYGKLIDRMNTLDFDAFKYDSQLAQPYLRYDAEGKENTIWYENENSINEKIHLVYDYDLGGISLWQLGNMPNGDYQEAKEKYKLDFWQTLMKNHRSN